MTILITGGAGFIGSNFIFYLLKHHPKDRIVCLDKLTYAGNLATLAPILNDSRFRFVQGDICDSSVVEQIFTEEKPQFVVNFAAESHVDRSIADPQVFLQTNILGTATLLEACRKFGVDRFHQISTDEVYGDLPLDRPDLQFTEASALCPHSPYSSSKAAADLLTLSYHRTYGLPVTVSRCSNNYGPYQYPEKLIPLMFTRAVSDQPLPIYGNGLNVRDWIYVEDHCSAVDLILRKGKIGEVYNIGGNCEISNLALVKHLLHCLCKSEELITYVADRKGHDLRYAICSDKLQTELGWHPQTNFESGIEQTIRWYQDNCDWWRPLLSQ